MDTKAKRQELVDHIARLKADLQRKEWELYNLTRMKLFHLECGSFTACVVRAENEGQARQIASSAEGEQYLSRAKCAELLSDGEPELIIASPGPL